jgi:hypothetical protein
VKCGAGSAQSCEIAGLKVASPALQEALVRGEALVRSEAFIRTWREVRPPFFISEHEFFMQHKQHCNVGTNNDIGSPPIPPQRHI